ncbi:hypothetical protein SAMN06265360_10635 [Haloechinothrix alba]|uniref:Uncharacterized protein n=1 Tax=Haloechinothrix alba TaxID=664784 RepID=A0A238WDC9_9PSEU|nr:hypothetical protein [Haloechinothrix alba]SNR44263.1 hypothetical protein SAMN06265360_10635 [Haloechinothrix alba]
MPKKRTAKSVEVAKRRAKAMDLYRMGWTYTRIYEEGELGYSDVQHVRTDMHRAIQDARRSAREYVDLESARLEGLMESFYLDARRRDPRAADLVIKLHDRLASLHGLDAAREDNAAESRSMVGDLMDRLGQLYRGGSDDARG